MIYRYNSPLPEGAKVYKGCIFCDPILSSTIRREEGKSVIGIEKGEEERKEIIKVTGGPFVGRKKRGKNKNYNPPNLQKPAEFNAQTEDSTDKKPRKIPGISQDLVTNKKKKKKKKKDQWEEEI